jgi:G patch domain/KOW motif-containing protein
MENGQDESVNKGSVVLCSWEELKNNPFRDKIRVENDGNNDGSSHKNNGNRGGDEQSSRKRTDDRDLDRRKRKEEYSDEDRERKRRRKESTRDKYYSDDDDRRRKSTRDKHYSDDDDESIHKKKRKESSRHKHRSKRDRSEERASSNSQNHRVKDTRDERKKDRAERSSNHQEHHLNWLLPNIRVRLVSKKYPRQHLNKGIVQDVLSTQSSNPKAVILMDNQEVLDNIPERYLETALPKTGGSVIVLEGLHRWKKGRLLERSSDRGKGFIQLFEDLEVIEVSLDGLAEWCGPLDEDME